MALIKTDRKTYKTQT